VDRVVVTGRFRPEQREPVQALLEAGPPYDLEETEFDRHAVYLSAREVVFVFEGADVEAEVDDLADDFFHPEIRDALAQWRTVLEEEPHIGRPVFVWERGAGGFSSPAAAPVRVGDVMDSQFAAVAPEDTLGEAVERLAAGRDRPALVTDFGRLVGLLSPRDVLRAVAERVHPSDARARDWMTEPVATIDAETSPDEAAAMMVEHGLHHLPVVAEGRAIGLVALHDVVGKGARRGS
jgi:CBS domain-containing protein